MLIEKDDHAIQYGTLQSCKQIYPYDFLLLVSFLIPIEYEYFQNILFLILVYLNVNNEKPIMIKSLI